MSQPPDSARSAQSDQRDALKRSEKAAAEEQPGSFKDAETDTKQVEIGADVTDRPIRGLDPKPAQPDASPADRGATR